jgi:peptidoglycan/xylan/chitin deacetylase (PgdA/CDA1 family)
VNSGLVRRRLKRVGAASLGRVPANRSGRVVGLCYHSIHPTSPFSSAPPDLFERHLEWLVETCDVISVHDMSTPRDRRQDRPAVVITFDDGYADNHEFAMPLLAKFDASATFFVTAGFVDREPAVIRRFEELRGVSGEDLRPLEWGQVKELEAAGFQIGSHTFSHPNLIRLGHREVFEELSRSKAVLEDRLSRRVELLAYPFGKPGRNFDLETVRVVRETGYSYAAAVLFRAVKQRDLPFALPRFFVTKDSVEDLAAKVMGSWDYLGYWQEYAPRPLAKLVSPQDFRF